MLPGVRNIIFDLDGTLIDSSAGVIEATNYALTELGEPPRRPDEIVRFIGYPLEEMFAAFTDTPIEQLSAKFQERARTSVAASARALPGADEILRLLHQARYRLAIATTKFTVHTEAIIRKMNWTQCISVTASGDEVSRVKPQPDLILLAIKRLGAGPDDTVMVGDTVNDILAARAAGIPVIAIRSPFRNDDLSLYRPNLLLPKFTDLKTVFNL